MDCICSLYVLYIYCICIVYLLYIYIISIPCILYMSCIRIFITFYSAKNGERNELGQASRIGKLR